MTMSVFVVDDDPTFRETVRQLLDERGYRVVGEASSLKEARQKLAAFESEVVLLDITLPDGDGRDLATELSSMRWRPQVLLTSSDAGLASPELVARGSAVGFVPKSQLASVDLDRYLKR
jgi:DNA-binding NarL/FixJ family response regulator